MYANKPHQGISPRTCVLMIAVLAGALFTMAAKWAEKPIALTSQQTEGVLHEKSIHRVFRSTAARENHLNASCGRSYAT